MDMVSAELRSITFFFLSEKQSIKFNMASCAQKEMKNGDRVEQIVAG